MLLFSILSRQPERWQIDRALADSLQRDIALLKAKPLRVIAVRSLQPPLPGATFLPADELRSQ